MKRKLETEENCGVKIRVKSISQTKKEDEFDTGGLIIALTTILLICYTAFPTIYSRIEMIRYYPTNDYNWYCNKHYLYIPVYDPYFEEQYFVKYIKCENNQTTVYRDLSSMRLYDNYDNLVSDIVINAKNDTTRHQIISLPKKQNLNIHISTHTVYSNSSYSNLFTLDCVKNSNEVLISETFTWYYLISNYMDKLIIREFSKNCTKLN